jgi:protein-disulfide isomerase
MQKKRAAARHHHNKGWIRTIAVVAIAIAIVLVVVSLTSAAKSPVTVTTASSALSECGTPTCGQANAPVTIDIYADFQCPFCARADGVLQQLASPYVDTGKVKLVYHNFPIIGPESETAAQAAECAGDQNKFWAYANYLFTHQNGENTGAFSPDALKNFAAQLGLNQSAFNTCLDSGKYSALVRQQLAEGQQRGVNVTPTFFINGKKYEGALPYDQMAALIDAQDTQK